MCSLFEFRYDVMLRNLAGLDSKWIGRFLSLIEFAVRVDGLSDVVFVQ